MKAVASSIACSILLSACAGPSARVAAAPSPAALAASAAVAEQIRRCYRAPRVPSSGRNIVTRLFARYTADGMLVGVPLLVSQQGLTSESEPYASRMAEAAKLAVMRCSRVRLPEELGTRRGSDFVLTFSPRRSA
ncbi:MAG TPA: hypothetical protein VGB57_12760 [Allosphingosinicella sp.]|jgi:hypothetical protein